MWNYISPAHKPDLIYSKQSLFRMSLKGFYEINNIPTQRVIFNLQKRIPQIIILCILFLFLYINCSKQVISLVSGHFEMVDHQLIYLRMQNSKFHYVLFCMFDDAKWKMHFLAIDDLEYKNCNLYILFWMKNGCLMYMSYLCNWIHIFFQWIKKWYLN